MRVFRSLLHIAIYALTYCCVVENKMAAKSSPVRKFASARAAVSDFIISSFVKDMRATIDDLVNKKGPQFNQSGGEQVAGYLSAQMLTKESDERKQKKREWRGKIRNMLAGKGSKLSRSEQLVKKLAPTVNVIKKTDPSPLVIFINRKSGGRTGSTLLEKLKPWFPLAQVCDLSKYSASDYLKLYSNCSDLRILICGGDGTVGWIMDEALRAFPGHSFNFGVIPLGTGNDLCIQLKDVPKDHEEYSVSEGLGDNKIVDTNPERSSNYVSSQYILGYSKSDASERQVVMNLHPSMVIADPSLLNTWYKNPKIVQLDRWAVKVNRVHGRKRKLLKLLLIQNKVKRRGNSIISGLSRIISRFWGFGAHKGHKKYSSSEGNGAKNLTDVDSTARNEGDNSGQVKKSLKKKKKEAMNFTMNNYLGVGVDGAVTLGFHSLRQKVPALFFSRWVNKLWYGMIGVRTLLLGWSRDLSQCCQLICDGEVVKIPEGTQSIIILNINSYAGGMKMWPEQSSVYYLGQNGEHGNDGTLANKSDYSPAQISDGLLEIVAVSGINHLGAIKAGISRATPIAQGMHITLSSTASLPVQLDGEPWRQKPCKMEISLSERVNIMLPTVNKTENP